MAGSSETRAEKIRKRAAGPAQDAAHLSRHFAMLESELGNRTSGDLLYAEDVQPRRSYAGLLFLMLLVFSGTLAGLAYQNGSFNSWLGSEGASVRKQQPWIKANDYKIIYVPMPAETKPDAAAEDRGEDAYADAPTPQLPTRPSSGSHEGPVETVSEPQ
jgi:hypothetical protein